MGILANRDRKRVSVGAVVVLCLFSAMVLDNIIRGPKAKQRVNALDRELRLIADPKSSNTISFGSFYKTSNGYAIRIVRTDLGPDEVEAYYEETLQQQGWYFIKKESFPPKARSIFCRDGDFEETAILELPNDTAATNYQYSLKIGWGIDYGCD